MKANEAPEKIYIIPHTLTDGFCHRWFEESFKIGCIEYVRKDAFIKKACDAYCKVCGHYSHTTPKHICRQACDYYKDFKKYMEE